MLALLLPAQHFARPTGKTQESSKAKAPKRACTSIACKSSGTQRQRTIWPPPHRRRRASPPPASSRFSSPAALLPRCRPPTRAVCWPQPCLRPGPTPWHYWHRRPRLNREPMTTPAGCFSASRGGFFLASDSDHDQSHGWVNAGALAIPRKRLRLLGHGGYTSLDLCPHYVFATFSYVKL